MAMKEINILITVGSVLDPTIWTARLSGLVLILSLVAQERKTVVGMIQPNKNDVNNIGILHTTKCLFGNSRERYDRVYCLYRGDTNIYNSKALSLEVSEAKTERKLLKSLRETPGTP